MTSPSCPVLDEQLLRPVAPEEEDDDDKEAIDADEELEEF
jgi:hypothetical protein